MKETKMTDDEFENSTQFNQDDDGLENLFNNLPGNQSPPADAPGTGDDRSSAGAGLPTFDGTSTQPGRSPQLYAFGALTGRSRLEAAAHTANGESPPPAPSSGVQRTRRLQHGSLVGTVAVVALAAGLGFGHVAWKSGGTSVVSASPASMSTSAAVASIADKVDPGLVDIDTVLGFEGEEAAGTGIVLTPSGEILTNNHVINGATAISVTDIGNGKMYSATVVGYDATKDIAVLQLHDASGLVTASIGNSSSASVGETVVGIGNAGGTGGTPSAAGGTVTALNRSITASDEGDGSSEQLTGLIQTNADIHPGDSGGSLVNSAGQVIAVDTAASAGLSFQAGGESPGFQGYAIPINGATAIAKEIVSGTSTPTIHIGTTVFLGVQIDSNTPGFGGPTSGVVAGAAVAGVITGSPAQGAGLGAGDVITSVDGHTVASADSLTELLEPDRPGYKVTIGWTTSLGQRQTATVQLTSGPPQ
jgi:S1-C subfamily serine protease